MNPNDLKQILDALTYADVREFSLRTGSFDLSLKRGPQAFAAPTPCPPPAPPRSRPPCPPPRSRPCPRPPCLHTPRPPPGAGQRPRRPAQAAAPAPAAEVPAEKPASKGTPVKAPIVGTFYASSSPDAAPYVKVGDTVAAGQVLCIIEAMKLMNEIEAEQGGTIREILVKNAEPVEYGQTLFIIE
ncbi:acetyl-CoA carboxylase biotin carboxyl carrier protein subunit [Deinococcus grandis]|nr:acetyl-CoA carboxylase biotin carboxyl carrier protein subunit [Deinococcus grandis]